MPVKQKTPTKKRFSKAVQEELAVLYKAMGSTEKNIQRLEREADKARQALLNYEKKNKALFFNHPGKGYLGPYGTWKTNPVQEKVFKAIESAKYKLIALTGDNQIGKTLTEIMIAVSFQKGYWVWETPKEVGTHLWDRYGFTPPIHVRIIGAGWEDHIKRVLVKELTELWPDSWKKVTRNNNQSVPYYWQCQETKSEIHFMSSDQEVTKFAGQKCHVVIFDEPFTKAIWDENVARIISKGGFIFIGATINNEDHLWLQDEILDMELSDEQRGQIIHIEGKAKDNMGHGTKKENVEAAKFLMTKEGQERRLEGKSLKNFGRIIKYDDKNIVPRKDIPPHWITRCAVDIGGSKEHDLLFESYDESNRRYLTFERQVEGHGKEIGEAIMEVVNRNNLRFEGVIIDPLAKQGQKSELSIYYQLSQYLRAFGISLRTGEKLREDGIQMLNNLFRGRVEGHPDLFIFDDLFRTLTQLKIRYDKNGKWPKKNDDQAENAYRLALLPASYIWPDEEGDDDDDDDDYGEPVNGEYY